MPDRTHASMHDIILLRHAAAMASAPDGTDGARPLSHLGENEAQAAGTWLREHQVQPARVLCSPAQRSVMTAERVLRTLESTVTPTLEPSIYDAVPGDLINLLEQHDTSGLILLVGHNPGIEQLISLLTEGRSGDTRGVPPAGLAWLRTDMPLEPGNASLHAFWSP